MIIYLLFFAFFLKKKFNTLQILYIYMYIKRIVNNLFKK